MSQASLFDLDPDELGKLPPGLTLLKDWVSELVESTLLDRIDESPWQSHIARRTQHYGYRYDYTNRGLDRRERAAPIPNWLMPIVVRLEETGCFEARPDQAIVNEYLPGQGIALHADHKSAFGVCVSTLSLADEWRMDLDHPVDGASFDLTLPRRSMLLLKNEARFDWRHGLSKRLTDPLPSGGRRTRHRRVSVTFRTTTDHHHWVSPDLGRIGEQEHSRSD